MQKESLDRSISASKLSKNENQHRIIIEYASDGIFVTDNQGNFTEVNKAGYEALGYTQKEILSMNVRDVVYVDADQKPLISKDVREGRIILNERKAICKNGTLLTVEVGARLLPDGRMMGIVHDITERKKIEDRLKMFETIMENATDAISVKDLEGRYIFVNQAFAKQHNLPQEEIIGKTVFDLYPANIAKKITEESKKTTRMGQVNITEQQSASKSEQVILQDAMMPLYNKSKETIGTVSISRDITELKNLESEIRNLSYIDPLTGLYNRRYFEEELNRLQKSRHYPITIFSLDLDDLKKVNDGPGGHDAGDKYLQKAADVLCNALPRAEDFKCRIGGDEFIAIVSEAEPEFIKNLTERLQFDFQNAQVPVSIGVATADNWKMSLWEVLKEADKRMYINKKARKATLNPTVKTD